MPPNTAMLRLAPAIFVAVLLVTRGALAGDGPPSADVKAGKVLFAEHCALCHGASGDGAVGPSLKGEGKRKTLEAIRAQIMDPAPPMARLYPSPLSKNDVADVAAFVATL